MSVSMYQASVPAFIRMLDNLSAILGKAAAYAEARKIDPPILIEARLYPDMLPLSTQIKIATDHAKGAGARLAGITPPVFADTEKTFAELEERINKTVVFLKTIKPEQMEGAEERAITLTIQTRTFNFNGTDYLFNFAQPNFYFHITTVYAILRHNGVEIGKSDFMGGV